MSRLRSYLQHHLNEMHLMCRLCELGLSLGTARKIAGWIGKVTGPILYVQKKVKES